jgi:hypothetical protein
MTYRRLSSTSPSRTSDSPVWPSGVALTPVIVSTINGCTSALVSWLQVTLAAAVAPVGAALAGPAADERDAGDPGRADRRNPRRWWLLSGVSARGGVTSA